MKLVSACLIGINCKFTGGNNLDDKVLKLLKDEAFVPICPEQLGGLPTPRDAAGSLNGSGDDVIDGKSEIYNIQGEDVTENFIRGAYEALSIARLCGIEEAVLKQESPSCGCGKTQWMKNENGKYVHYTVPGNGVTAALLMRNNIRVVSHEDL